MSPGHSGHALLLALLAAAAPVSAADQPWTPSGQAWAPPAGQAWSAEQAGRQQYLEQEARREAVRSRSGYGRYDRADRDRARAAAYDRMDGRWMVGGYIHDYGQPLHVVRDYRGYGMRRPPRGSHWMRGDGSDLLLVVQDSGLIADVVPLPQD